MTRPLTRLALAALLAVAGFLLPTLLGGSTLVYDTLVAIAIFSAMSYGLDVILSDLGEISLVHTAFFATGAYAAAILTVTYGFGAWTALAGAVLAALSLALVLGLITLRTREFAFSLVTYAAAVVCMNIASNWDFLGGSDGIVGIPPLDLSIGPLELTAGRSVEFWPFAYVLLLLTLYVVHRFRRSRLGQAALMVHMNPRLATMCGLDGNRIRLQVFLLSAVISAAAGWLYAFQRAYVGTDLFETYFLVLMLTGVILAGRRILLGPLLGTTLLLSQKSFASLGAYGDKLVLGVILVAVLCLCPRGLASLGRKVRGFKRRPAHAQAHAQAAADAATAKIPAASTRHA
ncbi:branched-chain amino acid transport system permease protein [Methylobacterium sp. ap11]|uniref:branched-chain amino acid ABC transporter permease n=1 Tax=Methylobacterium sp. ap11 TaxID=1761799 RepID=UPI0008C86331|nr:branched-chain amino acid ABC transporter permease [Methylobacterium sp. ap11]SEP28647.1 branched-chain amino acid transport system permease protein [Methylobacterium sp. ap11]